MQISYRTDDLGEIEIVGFKMILSFGLCVLVACEANSLPVPCTPLVD